MWVIDPIDGTRSFILGQMHWATLIALNDGDGPVVGVAHQPYVGESFMGTQGGGAQWRRGSERRALKTRRCPRLSDAVVACTDPKMFVTAAERSAFDRVAARARLTRWGGDCYAYCLLAMGLIDIVIEASLHAYDVQALMPIVGEAGGVITTWTGERVRRGRLRRRVRRSCAAPGSPRALGARGWLTLGTPAIARAGGLPGGAVDWPTVRLLDSPPDRSSDSARGCSLIPFPSAEGPRRVTFRAVPATPFISAHSSWILTAAPTCRWSSSTPARTLPPRSG